MLDSSVGQIPRHRGFADALGLLLLPTTTLRSQLAAAAAAAPSVPAGPQMQHYSRSKLPLPIVVSNGRWFTLQPARSGHVTCRVTVVAMLGRRLDQEYSQTTGKHQSDLHFVLARCSVDCGLHMLGRLQGIAKASHYYVGRRERISAPNADQQAAKKRQKRWWSLDNPTLTYLALSWHQLSYRPDLVFCPISRSRCPLSCLGPSNETRQYY